MSDRKNKKKSEEQQTQHVDSTLKRRGNDRFHVVSTWNPRGVFVGNRVFYAKWESRIWNKNRIEVINFNSDVLEKTDT